MRLRSAFGAVLVALTMFGAACGSSGDAANTASTAEGAETTPQAEAGETAPGSDDTVAAPAETSPPETQPPRPASGPVVVTFDDGRSWTLDGSCSHTPTASGPAASLWIADGENEEGAELNAIEAFPLSGDDTEPVTIVTFTDDTDQLYTSSDAEVSSDGSTMTVALGMYVSLAASFDQPIDFTATVTCST